MKPRLITAVGIGLGLTAGGAAIAVAGVPGLAGAASPAASTTTDDGSTTDPVPTEPPTDTPATTSTDSTDRGPADATRFEDHVDDRLAAALQPLVDDGTISQDQADRVVDALHDALPFGGRSGPDRADARIRLDTAADAIGISAEDLRGELADGASIADVAAEHGVEVQTVIDALVADASSRLDEQVAAGELDADTAAARRQRLVEMVTDLVERDGGLRVGGPDGRGFPGPHHRDGEPPSSGDEGATAEPSEPGTPAEPSSPSPPSAPSTTTGD